MTEVADLSSAPLVLYVDDERPNRIVFEQSLKTEFRIKTVGDGRSALELMAKEDVAVLVTDIRMPEMDGLELLAFAKERHPDALRMVITAFSDIDPILRAINEGLVARYIVKPFERDELLARLRALLRRRPPRGSAYLVCGDLRLNPDTRQVLRGEREIELTAREFELLEYLMRNERLVVSRQALLDEVWGYHPFAETNTIDVVVSTLRRKLEEAGEPRVLHTVRGAGYVLRPA